MSETDNPNEGRKSQERLTFENAVMELRARLSIMQWQVSGSNVLRDQERIIRIN